MIGERDLRLVTPEAVVLQFDTAGLPSRMFARAIDLLIQAVLLFVVLFASGLVSSAGGGNPSRVLGITIVVVATVAIFFVVLGYPAIFETLWKGRTPGKAAFGLRVVTTEGAPIRFRHAAIRSALNIVDVFIANGLVAIITILVTRNNQRVGDLVAGTIVVRERSGARAPTAVAFAVPPGCEAYAETLDVSAVTQAEYGAIRSFLLRAGTLPAHVRNGLAGELGSPLLARMHHVPPAWVGPELFLACVAAVYQRRFGAALPAAPAWNMPPPPSEPASWGVARPKAPAAPDAGLASLPPVVDEGTGEPPEQGRPAEPSTSVEPRPAVATGFEAPD